MKEKLVDINLSIDIMGNEIVASLGFMNTDSKSVHLDQQTICYDNIVCGDYFKIKDERGRKVEYNGMMVSREIDPEYFITLSPKEILEIKVKLSDIYQFKKGKKYNVQYSTYHPSYLEEQDLTKLESNVVEVVYK